MKRRVVRVLLRDGRVVFADDGARFSTLSAAPWLGGEPTGETFSGDAVARQLTPVAPGKIVCVGRNYAAHAAELGNEVPEEPLLFMKPTSSLLDPGGTIELLPASLSERVEHEVELGVVVGRRLKRSTIEECAAGVFGYTIVGDITARDLQRREKQWTRGKGADTFCPVGPAVVRGIDASALGVRCFVDGALRQDGTTAHMLVKPPALLAFIAEAMTLEPGDLVVTGTPAGVGPLVHGNRVRFEVDELGVLELDVREPALAPRSACVA
ncbi:MAG: fumarylacetoacetate hydrolase family protein [Deltaproteobacteria bacterium]|nr:fumarylacetoacetate hydrolase family protein [Deltaproteobacteria bacterium]